MGFINKYQMYLSRGNITTEFISSIIYRSLGSFLCHFIPVSNTVHLHNGETEKKRETGMKRKRKEEERERRKREKSEGE